jgi:hypothetical protein
VRITDEDMQTLIAALSFYINIGAPNEADSAQAEAVADKLGRMVDASRNDNYVTYSPVAFPL